MKLINKANAFTVIRPYKRDRSIKIMFTPGQSHTIDESQPLVDDFEDIIKNFKLERYNEEEKTTDPRERFPNESTRAYNKRMKILDEKLKSSEIEKSPKESIEPEKSSEELPKESDEPEKSDKEKEVSE